MTRVEFIKLEKPEKARHCCLLAETWFNRGKRVLIIVRDEEQGKALDRFMWTWRKTSFIPHAFLEGHENGSDEPVLISTDKTRTRGSTVLIMATPCPLKFVREFEHAYDFAETYDPELHEQARARFALYRSDGLDPRMCQ